MRYSNPRKLTTENIREYERKDTAVYFLLNRYKNPIYVGHSKNLQHRLKAIVYGRADYDQFKHKRTLKKKAKYYKRAYTKLSKARKIETKKKKEMRYNVG